MENSQPKRRIQFSLLSAAALMTIIALVISHWRTSYELAAAHSEIAAVYAQNRQLREELGHFVGKLSVEDKTKFHAVALETDEPNTWRWRLFVPKGARYRWCIAADEIPRNYPPSTQGAMTGVSNSTYWEKDNEVLVTARLRENDDGTWTLSVDSHIGDSKNQMAGASLNIPAEKMAWMNVGPGTDGQVIGSPGTTVLDPRGPIILLQKRPLERQPDGNYQPSEGPMPGYMIWLESR